MLNVMWTGVVLGTLGALSAEAWPTIWISIEINLISYLIVISKLITSKQICIIYFIVQSVGSLVLLRGGIMTERWRILSFWITLGLITKTRMAPVHFWGGVLLIKLSSLPAYLFLTWQKMAPIFLMTLLTPKLLLLALLLINSLVGSSCSVRSKNIYVVLFFSGLIHTCWLISAPMRGAYMYFFLYSLIRLPLFLLSRNIPILLLNLAGLPPLTGFFMKLYIIQIMNPWWGMVLILFSAIVLHAYLRAFLLSAVSSKNKLNVITVAVCGLGCLL